MCKCSGDEDFCDNNDSEENSDECDIDSNEDDSDTTLVAQLTFSTVEQGYT